MTIFNQYFLFLAKLSTITSAILLIISVAASQKSKGHSKPEITVLNKERFINYQNYCEALKKYPGFKERKKFFSKHEKNLSKLKDRLFIIDFKGDLKATGVTILTEEIEIILQLALKGDTVLLRMDSGGGTVIGYGLVATQVRRIREAGIHLVVSIDQLAASGGYLVAAMANTIIAAQFACVGSIGVAIEVPNFHNLLKNYGIEYTQVTSGKYKRTLTFLGPNTKEGEEKAKQDVERTHQLFKDYITQYRDLDIERVATGETWEASSALNNGLVDELISSDEYIQKQQFNKLILVIKTPQKQRFFQLAKNKASRLLQYLG
jgi:serine protease SohB